MKQGIVGITAVLVCLMIMAPALGVGVPIFSGSDGVSTNGITSGSGFIAVTSPGSDQYSIKKGLEAHVTIPAGQQGNAWARFHNTGTSTTTVSPTLNGEGYRLQAGYTNANVNAGVRKTSTGGAVSSNAMVEAYAAVDNSNAAFTLTGKKNYLSGWAQVSADTTSSTNGNSYALAQGAATYRVIKPNQAVSLPNAYPSKVVSGTASGTADVESIIAPATGTTRTGTTNGVAKIYATSDANDWKSSSYSYLSTDLSSARGTRAGTSTINAQANGNANSFAIDGTTPSLTLPNAANSNAMTTVTNNIASEASSYARGDIAATSMKISSQAWHNADNFNMDYEKAYNQILSSSQVTRTDMNTPTPNTLAQTVANGGSFLARARDNNDQSKYALERATLGFTGTRANLETAAGTISATKNLELTATQNNGMKNTAIRDQVSVNGALTGDTNDEARAVQTMSNLRAEASDDNGIKFVNVNSANVNLFVDGDSGIVLPTANFFGPSSTAPFTGPNTNLASPAANIIGIDYQYSSP